MVRLARGRCPWEKAWGHEGGTSIFPVIPVFPVLAWLAGMGLDYLWESAGFYAVGGLHVILTLLFLGSSALSLYRIRKKSN